MPVEGVECRGSFHPDSDVLKNLARANERCVAFGYEIVIKNRVCVRFSEERLWSLIGRRRREAPVCDNKFDRAEHIEQETSFNVCGWGGGRCEGGSRRVGRIGIAHPMEEGMGI